LAIGRPPPHFQELPEVSTRLELDTVLLDHFFPRSPLDEPHTILLTLREAIELEPSEIERALAHSSHSWAPGPDKTPNSVWKRINKVAPSLILNLVTPVVSHSLHPTTLKRANGIVLDKPGKPSYNSPSFFPIVVPLQTFSKILERIVKCNMCTYSGNGTQERAVQDLLCLVDLYLVYLI